MFFLASIDDKEAALLASRYNFSGGEIDNIVRKASLAEIIDGCKPSLVRLEKICSEEKIKSGSRPVGF